MKILSARSALSVLLLASCHNVLAYSLDDAVYATLAENPAIKGATYDASAAQQEMLAARGGLLPSLDVNAGIGREHSNNPATRAVGRGGGRTFTRREADVYLRQLIFDGGNVRGVMKGRRHAHDAAVHRVAESKERLGFDAVQAYHEILLDRELLAIRRLDVAAHKDMLKRVHRRMDAGAGRRSEIDLADSRLALSQARLNRTEGDLNNTYDYFIKVVGQPAPEKMEKPNAPNKLPTDLVEAQQMALMISPTIQVLSAQSKASEAEIGVAKAAFYPTFTLDLSQTYNNNLDGVPGSNQESQAMIRMNYNLFNGGSDMAAVKGSKFRHRAATEALVNTTREVNEGVANAWHDLQTANARINPLKRHRDESLAVYDAYVKQFQLGQRTLFDLLNAQSEYFDSRSNYQQGLFEVKVTKYRLLANIGTLAKTFVH